MPLDKLCLSTIKDLNLYFLQLYLDVLQGLKYHGNSMAGWYDNPIPTRFLAPIDCSKIPAQLYSGTLFLCS